VSREGWLRSLELATRRRGLDAATAEEVEMMTEMIAAYQVTRAGLQYRDEAHATSSGASSQKSRFLAD